MPVQLGLSPAAERYSGLRRGGDRRRENRGNPLGPERRHGERRGRRRLRHLLLTSLSLAIPHSLDLAAARIAVPVAAAPIILASRPAAAVVVSINSFVAVPGWRAYNDLISEAGKKYHVDPILIRSVMQTESAFNPAAVSRAGALGLMQLMPDVAKEFGVEDPFDPRENIMAGARQLRRLLTLHNGDVTLAVASYNAGAANVQRYGGVPPFAETQNYVERVTSLLRR